MNLVGIYSSISTVIIIIIIIIITRNTFCGTWYLSHSKSTTTELLSVMHSTLYVV